jgi:hypothetical protein
MERAASQRCMQLREERANGCSLFQTTVRALRAGQAYSTQLGAATEASMHQWRPKLGWSTSTEDKCEYYVDYSGVQVNSESD